MSPEVPTLLRPVIEQFEEIGPKLSWGHWTCHEGALALSYLCRKAGIEHTLQVGLYYWPKERLAEKYEKMEGAKPSKKDLREYWRDEHHHWVEVTDKRLPEPWLLDPNGEARHEKRAMPKAAAKSYRADPREKQWSGVGPDTTPEQAREWFPDLAKAMSIIDGNEVIAALPHPVTMTHSDARQGTEIVR